MHDSDCVFCKIIAGAIPCAKVFESENVLAFLDIEPIEKEHVLVIPKRHWPCIMDVPVAAAEDIECAEEVMYLVRVVAKALCRDFATGVNVLRPTAPARARPSRTSTSTSCRASAATPSSPSGAPATASTPATPSARTTRPASPPPSRPSSRRRI